VKEQQVVDNLVFKAVITFLLEHMFLDSLIWTLARKISVHTS